MDDSLHYLAYDPEDIWNEMIVNYVDAGGDILYPGDEKEMLLRSVLADIVQCFASVDNALRMQTLRYAEDEGLDVIGEMRGCDRIAARAATATVTIKTNATGRADVLEAGTAMTCDGEVFYLLVEDLILSGYQETVTVEVVADRAGSVGNSLRAGMEMGLAITNYAVNSIIVTTDASGGNDKEEDDVYRERIRNFGLASITTGPRQQYEAVARSASSEILDAKAVNMGAGKVGVYLILSDGASADTIIKNVTEALSAEDVRPLTDYVTVLQAKDIAYKLDVHYTAENNSAITSKIAQAVKDYHEWQDGTIGLAFNPDRLMALIYQAGAMRVTWGPESTFNSTNQITYTEIGENERCKGTITITETLT